MHMHGEPLTKFPKTSSSGGSAGGSVGGTPKTPKTPQGGPSAGKIGTPKTHY